MSNFANLTAQLNLNIKQFSKNMTEAANLTKGFASYINGQLNTGLVAPAKKAKVEYKDVARIVQGIAVSKFFYTSLNYFRQASNAVWEFSKELEYANMVYSNLFGDTSKAKEFINVLKDFAAITPFSFSQSEQAAKRLLAYGIQAENVMYVMQGVLAAATVQGNDQVIETISRALGQIYTKGRLMNKEMRQLAEAGIPVYEILVEKLGLTVDELRNLGRVAVPANEAINALVEGITERFGTTLQYASLTTKGIISNIKDNAVMLFSAIFEPFTTSIRNSLGQFVNFINEIRDIVETRGIGGVFERLVPPGLQLAVKQLIANFKLLSDILKANIGSVGRVLKEVFIALMKVFNAIAPALIGVVGALSAVFKAVTQNAKIMKTLATVVGIAAGMWAMYKIRVILAAATTYLVNMLTTSIKLLGKALTFVALHPVWAMLILGAGIFAAVAVNSEKLRASLAGVFKTMYSLGGMDLKKMLLPETKDRTGDINKFNKALGKTSANMNDLADNTNKASKAGKALQSFDEVFTIPDKDETGLEDMEDDYYDMLTAMQGMDFSDLGLEIPDMGALATNFIDGILGAFSENLLAAGIGSIIGGALGLILGGPAGAKIGMMLGALAGWFWPKLAEALGLTDIGSVAMQISTGLGAAIGLLLGGPLGLLIGVGIGALVGWIIDSFARGFTEGDWTKLGIPLGTGIGAAIGFIAGGPLGALIGGSIGLLIGWIADMLTAGFTKGEWDPQPLGAAIGTGIGAAIGFAVFGPAGAAIGAAIGALVGWLVGLIIDKWDVITEWFAGIGDWFVEVGEKIGTFFNELGLGEFFGGVGTSLNDSWSQISEWFVNTFAVFSEFFNNVKTTVYDALIVIFGAIYTVLSDIFSAVSTVFNDVKSAVSTVFESVFNTLKNVWELIRDIFILYGGKILDNIVSNFTFIKDIVTGLIEKVKENIVNNFKFIWSIIAPILQKIKDTIVNVFNFIWGFLSPIVDKIKSNLTNNFNFIGDVFKNVFTAISTKFSEVYNALKGGLQKLYDTFKNWVGDLWDNVFGKFFGWLDGGIKKLRELFGLDSKGSGISITTSSAPVGITGGHSVGGIFNREHLARFAEGDKAEAIIPLENDTAMRPFVDAVADGVSAALLPILSMMSGDKSDLRPLYVGTLIADERGLKELNRKMNVIKMEEDARRG